LLDVKLLVHHVTSRLEKVSQLSNNISVLNVCKSAHKHTHTHTASTADMLQHSVYDCQQCDVTLKNNK